MFENDEWFIDEYLSHSIVTQCCLLMNRMVDTGIYIISYWLLIYIMSPTPKPVGDCQFGKWWRWAAVKRLRREYGEALTLPHASPDESSHRNATLLLSMSCLGVTRRNDSQYPASQSGGPFIFIPINLAACWSEHNELSLACALPQY